eukprot:6181768-Pleurochrysis_carterae.AAC.2
MQPLKARATWKARTAWNAALPASFASVSLRVSTSPRRARAPQVHAPRLRHRPPRARACSCACRRPASPAAAATCSDARLARNSKREHKQYWQRCIRSRAGVSKAHPQEIANE